MDKIEKILKLAEIGYSKDEISRFLDIGEAPEQLEIKPDEKPVEKTIDEAAKAEPDYVESLKPYLEDMKNLLKSIQAANVRSAQMDEQPAYTGHDAIAEIINPTFKGGKR